jgi:hypothetical protein
MSPFETAFKSISELVKDFKSNEKFYSSSNYSEADVRNDFINKFFIALGWDVRHEKQKNPYEQEVRVEKPVQVAKAQKRADFTFYLAPNFRDVKFFVEAKKPYHDLENKDYFFQTIRYGWNANTPIAILTDFEELIILDCRYRPDIQDILNFKIKNFHYSEYANEEKFREIYYLFSRESVLDGSIEKYAENLPKPRGKAVQRGLFKGGFQSIDESFLEELDEIRTALAKSFKKNNSHLTSDELTEATQRTIDRLVFIKFLEDKLIEPHHYVSEFGNRRTAWEDFITASITLDAKYNGVVFKKSLIDSKNIIEPDDKTFSNICEELSHDNTPYNFDAIPIHILGSIYERFLGKVVNATDKRVTIEEKPEVRKAGGVYYTPQYIVNYIVDNTIGKLIEGKTPKEISKLRFADIACGSGSFLITVYERILDYHKLWYLENPEQAKKDGCIFFEGAYRLSLQQKQKLLTNNIYGIDLDQQAVEVTQLSLYLKLLEDETTATANDSWVMFKERLLPDLNKNVVCGNSLIGSDILEGNLFDFDEEKKLKPMDFEKTFPKIIDGGGFDAIVGNPPYGAELNQTEKNYLNNAFKIQTTDTAALFIDKANKLLLKNGKLAYIIPKPFLYADGWDFIRNRYLMNIETVIDCGKVWKKVKLEQVIIVETKGKEFKEYFSGKRIDEKLIVNMTIDKSVAKHFGLIISDLTENEIKLGVKIKASGNSFGSICDIKRGLDIQDSLTESNYFKLLYRSKSIGRYELKKPSEGINKSTYIKLRPTLSYMEKSKIVIQNIVAHVMNPTDHIILMSTIDEEGILGLGSVGNIFIKNEIVNQNFIVALLNSKLFSWFAYRFIYGKAIRTMRFDQHHLNKFSLPLSEIEKITDHSSYNKINIYVNQIIASKKQLLQARTESDKNYLERKCEGLDNQIDKLVYELYGLTEEEIKIVEGEK